MYRLFVMMAVLTLLSGCGKREPRAGENHLTVDVLLKTTPVKDQGRSALCWVYAMLATIETEHLMRGDSVNLSVSYAARMALTDRARTYYLMRAARPLSQRGMASELLHTIHTHGLLAYDTYFVPQADVFNVLGRRMQNVCRLAFHGSTHGSTTLPTARWAFFRARSSCWVLPIRRKNLLAAFAVETSIRH